jgi:hypothetical protein
VGNYDDRADDGKESFTLIGRVDGTLPCVAFTERDDRVRLLSARRATRHEQDEDDR